MSSVARWASIVVLCALPASVCAQATPVTRAAKPALPPASTAAPGPQGTPAARVQPSTNAPPRPAPQARPGVVESSPPGPSASTAKALAPQSVDSVPTQGAVATAGAEPLPAQTAAKLEQDTAAVMDELVQLRARTQALGRTLFKTRVRIRVASDAGQQRTARLSLYLDGAPVWTGDGAALADPERVLFEGPAAPGIHVLTYELEQRAKADEAYRYEQRTSLRFSVRRDRHAELTLHLADDSDVAEAMAAGDDEGEYDLRVRLEVGARRMGD